MNRCEPAHSGFCFTDQGDYTLRLSVKNYHEIPNCLQHVGKS